MIHIIRKEQEALSGVVRRFVQRVQASGILKEAKGKRHFLKPLNKNARRVAALNREKMREHYGKLRKMGRVK
ncbi:MAG: hypothetical protein A3B96_03155 [Candidatus Spechtbacteria bacterium RIFCSPHIGHO2_02_FULL_43_15b]|uniref:30S ribosomal protein S21 n=1 Tax=Candidatus Spechtbacteria bacterium RIFCSPHIGHO2_01_FULL_43_30 TaxID=1802158 RepID=A0A1G2H8S9_9BACT|nr:MAG: hypothetical protein A2827_00495 [Candidatus Spechtbacteria bacterium RIFCSPHIGHO2_01_FULL_43_30]OGZ59742.1 MAG: hypothetical protein A3B96_03155 [Candidatus Spechtbacteria bacterium RIFCSPHIGHO2_02_FULL_43_15b]